jgi:hypothetical protein
MTSGFVSSFSVYFGNVAFISDALKCGFFNGGKSLSFEPPTGSSFFFITFDFISIGVSSATSSLSYSGSFFIDVYAVF